MLTVLQEQQFEFTYWAETRVTLGKINDEYVVGIKAKGSMASLDGIVPLYFETLPTLEEAEAKYEEVLQVMHTLNKIRWRTEGKDNGKE